MIIDKNVINSLMMMDETGDGTFLKEIVELYLEQIPGLVNDIKSSFKEKDSQTLFRSAHNLKGASLNLGAVSLASVCKRIEENGKEENYDAIENEITELDACCEAAKLELKNIINF